MIPLEYPVYRMLQKENFYAAEDDLLDIDKCPDAEANAKLSAAAPDLLEMLQSIIEAGKRDMSNPKYDTYFEGVREAI
ncbi:MAG: hypothetical protein ABI863_00580 [Ginsengibacter sp.]